MYRVDDHAGADVIASSVVVTVVDTATFDSSWVVLENQTAHESSIPIQTVYDADVYRTPRGGTPRPELRHMATLEGSPREHVVAMSSKRAACSCR